MMHGASFWCTAGKRAPVVQPYAVWMSAWARVFHSYGRASNALRQDTIGPLDPDTSDGGQLITTQ
jgi:hypothetical protein